MAADCEREAEALSWSNFSPLSKQDNVTADQIIAAINARLAGRIDSLSRTDMLAVEEALLIDLAKSR